MLHVFDSMRHLDTRDRTGELYSRLLDQWRKKPLLKTEACYSFIALAVSFLESGKLLFLRSTRPPIKLGMRKVPPYREL